jgi:hypothetical protein
MYIYEALKVLAMVAAVSAVLSVVFYCIAVWLVSRDTHIEPMKFEPKRTHKFPKVDISVAYQGAKVGQVLGGRK